MAAETVLQTEWLTGPVRAKDVRQFARTFVQRHPEAADKRARARRVVVGVGLAALAIGLLAMGVGISQEIEEAAPDMVGHIIAMGLFVALMLTGAVVMVWWILHTNARRGTPERHYRLARFAADNAMAYLPGPYLATHLTPWASRGQMVITRVLRPRVRRQVEFANLELIYADRMGRHTQFGGYCAIRLATRLPHILLQAAGAGRRSFAAAAMPAGSQRLSLEGDFDRRYTLYCPHEYERDALYLFTPDVMARVVDDVRDYDIEIVDDWLFLVRKGEVVGFDPRAWYRLIDAANALGDKIAQWERWRDNRPEASPPPAATGIVRADVAPAGRRLRMVAGGATWIWVGIGIAVVVGVWIANVL